MSMNLISAIRPSSAYLILCPLIRSLLVFSLFTSGVSSGFHPGFAPQAWAEVSGSGRANGDPSVWKRNFRSALRAKGFKMVDDNKNDAANPHKVFQWPDESTSKGEDPLTIWILATVDRKQIQFKRNCLLISSKFCCLALKMHRKKGSAGCSAFYSFYNRNQSTSYCICNLNLIMQFCTACSVPVCPCSTFCIHSCLCISN